MDWIDVLTILFMGSNLYVCVCLDIIEQIIKSNLSIYHIKMILFTSNIMVKVFILTYGHAKYANALLIFVVRSCLLFFTCSVHLNQLQTTIEEMLSSFNQ
jgi:hypothetical protein